MNRLWPGGVKFGLTTTGLAGIMTSVYNNFTHKTTYFFHDPNAHFKSYMVNLDLEIAGKGSYLIATVASDTQLTLKSYPAVGTYTYWINGLTGFPVDTVANKQTGPSITSDGTGGCYLAWTSSATIPNSIYATRIDTTGTALWDPAPGPGFRVYQDANTLSNSKNVWINRDGNELLLTWEVYNANTTSQDVYAERMTNSSLYDTAFEWGAVNVSNQIDNQTLPRIYGDDSEMFGRRGVLVPFLDQEPGSTDDLDVAMVRVMGDGASKLPPAGNGFSFFDQKPHTQSGMRTVKITDPSSSGTATGVLAVWNDAWDGQDTMVYAQRMDRVGRRYFPNGNPSRWGLAIAGDSADGGHWTAKQVALIPRGDNGGIAVWTDFRSGNADIYAQLILGDGVATIPTDLEPPVSTIISQTGSYNGNPCNSRITDVLAVDTGSLASGIQSITAGTMINMKLTANVPSGKDSVPYTVRVTDSMLNGTASVAVTDVAGNEKMENFTYCTISDTLPPLVTWDSNSTWIRIHFTENRPWDRGLDTILLTDSSNVN